MKFYELVSWLFDRSKLVPQLGYAGSDKKAWLWLPGHKEVDMKTVLSKLAAPLKGCTQLAYEERFKSPVNQACEICWVGLDIDADDNPGVDLLELKIPDASMIRSSVGGQGIHVIYRLDKPVPCTYDSANKFIKAITAPLVHALKPIVVCKADRRMFWLDGGYNRTLHISPIRLSRTFSMPLYECSAAETTPVVLKTVSPVIAQWAHRLGISFLKHSTPIYVGDVVKLLRDAGQRVDTKSGCSGNGHVNGYLDITPFTISLFAYADGHTIWSFTDVEALLNENTDSM